MDITTNDDWTWAGDQYRVAYATTDDPRVLAVIEREEDWGGGHIDGDAYAPAFYYEKRHGGLTEAGETYMDNESRNIAERIEEARDRFLDHRLPSATIARYAWIFWGTTFEQVSSSIDQETQVIIFNTPSYRAHIGQESTLFDSFVVNSVTGPGRDHIKETVPAATEAEARATHLANHPDEGRFITTVERVTVLSGDVQDWTAALGGEVYGIGWAVNEGRVLDDNELDLDEFTVEIQVWGYLGEEYAKSSAAAFEAGTPDLAEMLDLELRERPTLESSSAISGEW